MNIAIVGATGLVGQVILEILEKFEFDLDNIYAIASKKSIGKSIKFRNQEITIISIENAIKNDIDVAIFSAGKELSLKWAPIFINKGIYVIDNSSAWRMDETKKLIVPEINGHILEKNDKIIPNPNCSTIQMVMAIHSIHAKYNILRIIVSTYQSISGTGRKAIAQLEGEQNSIETEKVYPHQIYKNAIPHCDEFEKNGYTKEEMKLVNETNKILDSNISITATAVRLPISGGHSESINLTLENQFKIDDIKSIIKNSEGVILEDNPSENLYPMPLSSQGKDEVYVGRVRRDNSCENSLNMWVVSDNLRKGAATNTIQIIKLLVDKGFIN
ncbi:MAG: aspartate-semialdehyde dehydrogenase [Flavobacteriaceae bacterium]|tara:strand:+ start:1272 stop:2261 length:990 start_codon:yes stop_codon:yes gene_type:complete